MFKRMLVILMVLAGSIGVGYACSKAEAQPINLTAIMAPSPPGSLFVAASWNASTVPVNNGPITYPVVWKDGTVTVRTATLAGTVDTLKIARAPIGKTDTIFFGVSAFYAVSGKSSAQATLTKLFPNADNQTPTMPVIISVDSTK